MAETNVEKLLGERQKQHGDFLENARLSQALKDVLRSGDNWEKLPHTQKEALELVCTKLGRIMSGDSGVRDHWDDVAGYAALGSRYAASPSNVSLDLRRAMGGTAISMPQIEKAS